MIIQYDWCLYHGETVGHTETDTEYHMKLKAKIGVMDEDEGKDAGDDDEDEDWNWGDDEEDEGSDASTSQGAQGFWEHQKAGEELIEQIGPHNLRMNQSADTVSPEFWPLGLRNNKFLLC